MNVCVIGEQGKQHKLINLVINIFFMSFGRLIEEELFTDQGADLLGKGVCFLPCLPRINLGKSSCAPCVLSLITTNSVTSVLHGGKMLHSKPNNVDINNECIVGVLLTTETRLGFNRCFE